MECCLCNEKEGVHKYKLIDQSTIDICDECGKIVYGIEFKPAVPDRLFHIIAMLEYVKEYKQSKQKVLVKK
ncbi:MAG: hypothetical protein ACM3O4_05635 [Ignavibacteriales bacterium]